jgi:lysine-specific histone demethylase 1
LFFSPSQDKHVKEKQINHWKEIIGLQEKLKANQNRITAIRDQIEDLHKQHKEIEDLPGTRDVAQEFNFRFGNIFSAI